MVVTARRALLLVSAATAMAATALLGAGQSAATGPVVPAVPAVPAAPVAPVTPVAQVASGAGVAPEADVSHHGHVSLWGEQVGIWLRSENRGPSSLENTTVRLRFSVPLTAGQELPQGCTRGGERAVLCATGALRSDGEARRTALALRVTGEPAEVVVRVDTVWNGGASDRNPANNTHEVLAPATGDAYAF